MEELLAAAATALKAPEGLVDRSARARAKAEGVSVEDVLRAWSGGGDIVSSSSPAAAAEAPEPVAQPTAPAAEPTAAAAEPEPAPEEPRDHAAVEPEPAPAPEPEPDLVAAGLLPRWLVTLFVLVPLFAVGYALFLPNGPACGDSGRLAVDPVTGLAVNCDGSEYGSEATDFFAIGESTYATCAACHGAGGGGGGNFPAFTGGALLSTFPTGQCSDQVEWVRLGTAGWPEATYGATDKPVGGSGAVMPAFGNLTEEQLRSVVLYERVAFGGEDLATALTDCGLDGETDDPAVSVSGD
jgi:mono/diheme cytochrome c family protein